MRTPSSPILTAAFLAFQLQLSGCAAPGYYLQAVSGHLDLMRRREEISAILDREKRESELARALTRTIEIRTFAIDRLGLPESGSYTLFVRTGREAVTWNVVAAPELSLEPRRWCFPVSGCVPYRGYFEHPAAEQFAERMSRKGYDVDVAPATAYSTLGWFDDPVLDTMLRYPEAQLAAIIFHEMAHQKLYVRGDATFNESYAGFVEDLGVRLWLQSTGQNEQHAEWLQQRQARAEFDTLVAEVRRQLSGVYASAAPDSHKRNRKKAILEQLADDYRQLVRERWQGRDYFGRWFSGSPNNAQLALYASYRAGLCTFAELYRANGKDLDRFHARAAELARTKHNERRAWLDRPCPVVASPADL
jgi:predicted aminopeptidase